MGAIFGSHKSGRTDGALFVFLHGWPDNESLWLDLARQFEPFGHCVRLTLPGFAAQTRSRLGYNFVELIAGLKFAIDTAVYVMGGAGVDTDLNAVPIILIGHDWGAHLAYPFDQQ